MAILIILLNFYAKITCLPFSYYHFSFLPPLKGYFEKYFFYQVAKDFYAFIFYIYNN